MFKKIILYVFIAIIMFCSGFFAAIKYNQGTVSELENRIARVTETNRQLQDENAAITRRAQNLTVRLNAIGKRAETAREYAQQKATLTQQQNSLTELSDGLNY